MTISTGRPGGTVQMLHAQSKPLAYTLAEIVVKDEDGYKKIFCRKRSASSRKAAANIWPTASTERQRLVAPRRPIASSYFSLRIWTR